MHFQTGENNSVTMSIASGCQMCAFTGAVGTMDGDGVKLNIVASGKGVWVDHLGEISAQGSEEVLDINSFFLVCVYMGGGGVFLPLKILPVCLLCVKPFG